MKISLNIKRNIKEIVLRDIPVYKDGSLSFFKPFEINSENGKFTDSVMMLYINDADAVELSNVDNVVIEKRYDGNLICSKKLTVHNIVGSYLFLRYGLFKQKIVINTVADYVSTEGRHYYELTLGEDHGIAPHDYDVNNQCVITVIDNNGNELCHTSDFFVTGGKNYGDSCKIYLNIPSNCEPVRGYYIEFDFDQYIYNDSLDYSGSWHFYSEDNSGVSIRFIYEKSNVCVPVGLSSDTDYIGLRQNEVVDDYYKKLTEGIIPEFINPEKTKYIPCIYSGDDNGSDVLGGEAVRIDFCLHFRTRQKEVLYYEKFGDTGKAIYGEMPSESWSIETGDDIAEGEYLDYWNEYSDHDSFTKNGDDILYSGDLIGNLGFTDNDILNMKKKVKQSFIRLSFYNTNNPLQTSMLFYSTIFLNVNELYSKYLKLFTSEYYDDITDDYLKSEDRGDDHNNNWGLVLFNGKCPRKEPVYSFTRDELLTTKISVSSENDHTSSAEGFNIYLFSDDSPKDGEERTIYMKVEFNHAGYGRTFPMILWPGLNERQDTALTKDNYYEYLYIPVVLRYNKEKNVYTYHIKRAHNDTENNVIKLALFEPKIEPSF